MVTKVIKIEDREPVDESGLREAAEIIRGGGLVAFPTETVYGLGANALDGEAAQKIYAAKGRPSDNPLIAHVADWEGMLPLVADIPENAKKLADAFWPGPMTLILNKSSRIPKATSGGLDTVAIRMPSDPVAHKLIELSGVPIAAPSANTSGRPSPTRAEHVLEDMNGKIELILDGGPVKVGVESTIVDLTGEVPALLRPGAVTLSMLEKILGKVDIDPALKGPLAGDVHPKAPGMKYRHYAPKAELILVEGNPDEVVNMINTKVREAVNANRLTGIIATAESQNRYPLGIVKSIGMRSSEESIAHNLFSVLREFDDAGVDIIYSESFPSDDLGQAIMNRLMKAAGYHSIHVIPKKNPEAEGDFKKES